MQIDKVVIFIASLLLLTACGGSLNDEQRKKLKERMKEDEIRKITPGQIMEASFDYGRSIVSLIEKKDPSLTNSTFIDSLQSALHVKISSIQAGDPGMLGIESKVIDAYMGNAGQANVIDDVQKIGTDSVLYTKPIMRDRPDGSSEFIRAISIHIPVSAVVMSMEE